MRRRGPRGVGVLLALVLVLAGCAGIGRDPDAALRAGPGSGTAADAAAVRAAAAATIASGGADVSVAAQGPARDRPVQITGEGTADLAQRRTRLLLRVGDLGPVRARLRDGVAYAALPPDAVGGIARGRSWVSVALGDADPGLYADTVVQLGAGVTGNPADVPTLLAALGDRDAVVVGPDAVDGAPATRYKVTIDLARVEVAVPELAPVLRRYRADTGSAGLPTASVAAEVWVDATGRLRRVVQLLGGAGAVSTVTFTAFGPRAGVPVPEAERVTDLLASLRS